MCFTDNLKQVINPVCDYNQSYLMKPLTLLAICMVVIHVSAQVEVDLTSVPEDELKALQQSVKFKATQAAEQLKNMRKDAGFFSNLFGGNQDADDRPKFLRADNEQEPAQGDEIGEQLKDLGNLMNMLPYEALLPRRRQPLGLLNTLLQGDEESSESGDNPLKELDKLLSGRKRNKEKKLHWENPEFKEGRRSTAFSKIFGPKSKGKHQIQISQEEIQGLLESSMPSLKGGRIINLSYVPHRKGVFLNIEYETAREQIYKIKAKYMRKSHQLEIINLTEINVLRKVEDDSASESDSEGGMEITLAKQANQEEQTRKTEKEEVSEHFEVVQQKKQPEEQPKSAGKKESKEESVKPNKGKEEKEPASAETKEVEETERKETKKQDDSADIVSDKKTEKAEAKEMPEQKQKEVKSVGKKTSQLTRQGEEKKAIEIIN